MRTILVLEDGTTFEGQGFGTPGEVVGEIVFNTSIVGYQEILTDPSNRGQIVVMTYPLIGNYGINDEDSESDKVHPKGIVVKELSRVISNFRAKGTLEDFMKKNGLLGIKDIDTRALTVHLREHGEMGAIISSVDFNTKSLIKKIKNFSKDSSDLVKELTVKEPIKLEGKNQQGERVVVLDLGIRLSLLRQIQEFSSSVIRVPASCSSEDMLTQKPSGIIISDGPGDPQRLFYVVEEIKKLLGKLPIFGISLGHLLLGLTLGAKTYNMKVGHHGSNQPVKNLIRKRCEITYQNHSFSLDKESLPSDIEVTHINLNDSTIEGINSKKYSAFSVQFYPAMADARPFLKFIEMMKKKLT